MRNISSIILYAYVFLLFGCDKEVVQKRCDPIPLVDGFRTIKVKEGNWTLKVPSYVNFNSHFYYESKAEECQYVEDFSVDYVWYQGKLLSHTIYADKLPRGEAGQIRVFGGVNKRQAFMDEADSEKVKYKYEVDFTHSKFPLAHLPRAQWDDPVNPSALSLDLSKPPTIWAIMGTKYGTPMMHYPFSVSCDFDYGGKKFNQESVVNASLTKNGDAKCRGGVWAEKNNKYVGGTVYVWANLGGKDQSNIKDINKIYDAIVEEFNSYIQE